MAYCNVGGPHFIAYHELFDSIADHLLEDQDLMAERAAMLGAVSGQMVEEVSGSPLLPGWPKAVRADRQVIPLLGERIAQAANLIRADIDTAANLGDADTADLFTEVPRQPDKDLWFVVNS